MKFILLLLILVSCNKPDPEDTKQYLYISGGYVCETLGGNYTPALYDCTSLLTGEKVDRIINATNIRRVEK